jgi:hypothetical protein
MPDCPAILLVALVASRGLAAQEVPPPKPAEEKPAKPSDGKSQEERLRALEEEVRALKESQAAAKAEPVQIGGAGAAASKALNPDISLNGDFLAAIGHNDVRPVPGLEMHEAELGIQSVIDPYSRGDVFISFSDQGVSVEEAYVTFTSLPAEFVAKVGKQRAAFGKVNLTHNHAMPWTDRPLVTENLVGGEDGIDDMGVSVSRILPAPGDLFLEATVQVFRGTSDDLFLATQKGDLAYVGHLRGYQDLTENTNLELGYSYAQGHNGLGHEYLTKLNGVDLSLRWKPLNRSIYTSLLWRTECVWSDREQPTGPERAFGLYSSLDYRFSQRWTAGLRYDWSERAAQSSLHDLGASATLTYWMSEFSQARAQYRRTEYAGSQNASELRLQLLFVMGAHGAHPF